MSRANGNPIYSSHSEDLDMRESIDEFVVRVAERVDQLQDAECSGDWELLASLTKDLTEEATRVGFDPLSKCAELVSTAWSRRATSLRTRSSRSTSLV